MTLHLLTLFTMCLRPMLSALSPPPAAAGVVVAVVAAAAVAVAVAAVLPGGCDCCCLSATVACCLLPAAQLWSDVSTSTPTECPIPTTGHPPRGGPPSSEWLLF
jgi:hypothetical protein